MELYIARQPVFDKNKAISGYELLHRTSGLTNEYTETDGEYASSQVITGAFLSFGLDSLTDGKQAYINFTTDLLTSGVASLLPKEQLVVEVLESIVPTREVLRACEKLKADGYTLALDDYVLSPYFEPLAALADIIKVDFRQTSEVEQFNAIAFREGQGIQFLAEKVETEEEFLRATALGYSLFQGYFFSRPVMLSTNMIQPSKLGYIRLMQAVNSPSPDFRTIISAIESDVTLSLETIRLSNSAFYARRQKIMSIKQAVVALGLEGVRKWIYLASLRRLGAGKPDALVSTSIIRSKFMELIAYAVRQPLKSPEYSMIGLFSMLDALTGHSFESLLSNLNIADEIKEILIGSEFETKLGQAYCTMLNYERGDWESTETSAVRMGLTLNTVAEAYMESLKWFNEFLSISAA
jgi:EAL and modified HD-GYP domain-containing signal transduction protein